jgi:regulator of protease activity HflC (stomatin/prohibitin superfamily)
VKELSVACAAIITLMFSGILIWFAGSSNPVTPAGYVGYVTQNSVLGKTQFIGTQTGPTSPGRTWMIDVTNISITPYTYDEIFAGDNAVLSKDNLKVCFSVHIVWRIHPDRVRQFMEKYSTINPDHHAKDKPDEIVETAYKNYLKEPLRTYARDEIQKYDGLEIKQNIDKIGSVIQERVLVLTKDTPFDTPSVVVGNIQYPPEVADAVSQKLAAVQILERKATEVKIEEAERQKRVVQAKGIAEAMDVINQKLTPMYLSHEAIEAQKAMINSPNHTTIYVPVGNLGVPLVQTVDNHTETPAPAKSK